MKSSRYFPVFLALVVTLTVSVPAYAYLDPGTGSVIYQALIVAFLAAAAAGRFWWTKVKGLFGGSSSQSADETEAEE